MATKRLKAAAASYVPQSKDACAQDLARVGELQREHTRMVTVMNDEVAVITKRFQPQLEALQTQINHHFKGVQAWCEAHRAEITDNLKVKTANLVTGDVTWRINTPSCTVRGELAVLEALKKLGLGAYVRSVESLNKEAVLATHMAARQITADEAAADAAKRAVREDWHKLSLVPGLTVVSGVESFSVTPFEQEVTS